MDLRDLFETNLYEFGGSHGFGGFGQRFFARRYYWALVDGLDSSMPGPAKKAVVDWLCDALKADNPAGFKPEQFRRAVEEKRSSSTGSNAQFQQRHFYYLAELVTRIESKPMREYIAMWLADFFQRNNGNFQRKRWFDYCGVPDPDAHEEPKQIGGRKRSS